MVGRDRESLVVACERRIETVQRRIGQPKVIEHIDGAGLQHRGPFITAKRLIESLEPRQRIAAVEVRFRIVRLQGDHAVEAFNGFGISLKVQQGHPAIAPIADRIQA